MFIIRKDKIFKKKTKSPRFFIVLITQFDQKSGNIFKEFFNESVKLKQFAVIKHFEEFFNEMWSEVITY